MQDTAKLLAVLERQHAEACYARHWGEAERIAEAIREVLGVTR